MKKAEKRIYWKPTDEAPSKIVPPIEKSLPMPERIISGYKTAASQIAEDKKPGAKK